MAGLPPGRRGHCTRDGWKLPHRSAARTAFCGRAGACRMSGMVSRLKRGRWWLLAAAAVVVVGGVAFLSTRDRLPPLPDRIREGMTVEEVVAVLGREADEF